MISDGGDIKWAKLNSNNCSARLERGVTRIAVLVNGHPTASRGADYLT